MFFKELNTHTVNEDVSIREFFKALCERHIEKTRLNARLDFLAAHTAHTHNGPVISAALQSLLEVMCQIDAISWKDIIYKQKTISMKAG